MSRAHSREKSGGTNLAFVVVLLAVAAGLFLYRSGSIRRMIRRSRPENAPQIGYKPSPDVLAAAFSEYCAEEAKERKIKLDTVKTSDKFKVATQASAVGTRAFLVTPEQYFQFVSADIAALVREGLSAKTLDGQPCDPFYSGFAIATNAEARTWTVTVKNVNGEGRIVLKVSNGSAEHKVERPRLFPVWKFVQYSQPAASPGERGCVFVQGCTVMEKDRAKENDKDCSVIAPNKASNFCGFRVYGVSASCVWFEVVYYGLSHEIRRTAWPDAEVVYRLENGVAAPPKVRFADGTEIATGKYVMDGGDFVELSPGGILDHRAVFFGYFNAEGKKVADMVCVDFSKPTL